METPPDDFSNRPSEPNEEELNELLEQEAELLLSEAATRAMDRGELLDWTRRIRAMTPEHLRNSDSTEMIRQDRDRR